MKEDIVKRLNDLIRAGYEAHGVMNDARSEIKHLRAEIARLREALLGATAALTAAISLLERSPSSKRSAPSDKMFEVMLSDYRRYAEQARAALAEKVTNDAAT